MLDATRLPEVWKPVVGFEGWYDVSSHGNVRSWHFHGRGSQRGPKPISAATHKDGRQAVFITLPGGKGVNFKVHVLVMAAFVGPRPAGMDVCHNDGNPRNNYVGNLRYDTHRANIGDAIVHGTTPKGTRNGMNILTPEDVLRIVDDWEAGQMTQREIGVKYGVSRNAVSHIVNGQRWAWLTGRRTTGSRELAAS